VAVLHRNFIRRATFLVGIKAAFFATSPYLSFGGVLVGATMALLALVGRFPERRLVDRAPQWGVLPTFRGLERLDVSLA
jgi:hypothetical protein